MKKMTYCLLLLFCFSLNVHAASVSLTEYLNNIKSMQANFSQKMTNKFGMKLQQANGTMYIQRPGLFRWEVHSPISQLIIANQKKLWVYDKDLEQVTIRRFQKSKGEAPALLLSEANPTFEKDFVIQNPSNPSGMQWFKLTPKDRGSLFTSIKIGFLNKELREMQLYDHMGQINIIKFSRIQNNKNLAATLFNFKAPPNVDVINETQP